MNFCVLCRRQVGGMWGVPFNAATGRCVYCEQQAHQLYEAFRAAFRQVLADGKLTHDEWSWLQQSAAASHLAWEDALAYVQPDAYAFVERTLAFAAEDGLIDERETANIEAMLSAFRIPATAAQTVLGRIAHVNRIASVRSGHLPALKLPDSIHLDAGEQCFLHCPATRLRKLKRTARRSPGTLIATSAGLQFIADVDGASSKWGAIVLTERNGGTVRLGTAKASGALLFSVEDPAWVEAVIETALRRAKRQIVTAAPSRHIPQDVKIAVWQRDGGACVQCKAIEYLEFDHIIPFSLGGGSSFDNVQVLCRRCNLAKSDRL